MHKCSDCDENNPQWGSLNLGVILCDECSSIHRHLGRHITQIKHLTKSRWRKTQLAMLKTLALSGANKYWEHLLIESTLPNTVNNNHSKEILKFQKPTPKDSMLSIKNDFIKEKYVFVGFFKKPRIIVIGDLSEQLHATVRTGILEISLYLLTLGARPNFIHPIKRTTSLHVAAMYNQPLQVELLLNYGADLLLADGNGDTALQIAHKQCQSSNEPIKWQVLITCLIEAQFEITDTLSYYLCRQTIDHSLVDLSDPLKMINNVLIPKLIDNSDLVLSTARDRLQQLPRDAFIDLCLDICDEIDRRDTNDIISSINPNQELTLFFLPPNPNYSSTRNQGRQKLARLSIIEFRLLCHDVLTQTSVRLAPQCPVTQVGYNHPPLSTQKSYSLPPRIRGDKEPVYDQVASDCEYSYVKDLPSSHEYSLPNPVNAEEHHLTPHRGLYSVLKNKRISMPVEIRPQKNDQTDETYLNSLLNKVDDLTGRNKLLQLRNTELEKTVKSLECQVSQLRDEKTALLAALTANNRGGNGMSSSVIKCRDNSRSTKQDDPLNYHEGVEEISKRQKESANEADEDAYDLGSDSVSSGPWLRQEVTSQLAPIPTQNNTSVPWVPRTYLMPNIDSLRIFSAKNGSFRNSETGESHSGHRIVYESRDSCQNFNHYFAHIQTQSNNHKPVSQVHRPNVYLVPDYDPRPMEEFPRLGPYYPTRTSNEVVNIVENIFVQIRSLVDIANGRKRGDFLCCSNAIKASVQHLVRLFAGTERLYTNNPVQSVQISTALRDLLTNSRNLHVRCENRGGIDLDLGAVIQHAHEIAMAAKLLLTHHQYEGY